MLQKDKNKRITLKEVQAFLKKSYFHQAEQHFKSNEYSKAIEFFNKTIELKDDYETEAIFIKGRCLLLINEKEEAIQCFEQAFVQNHIGALIYKGFFASSKNESKEYIAKALQINANPVASRDILRKEISLEALFALNSYENSVSLERFFSNAMYNKAAQLYEIDDYKGALNRYEIAIELNLFHANSLNNLGCTLIKLCEFNNALYWYDQLI